MDTKEDIAAGIQSYIDMRVKLLNQLAEVPVDEINESFPDAQWSSTGYDFNVFFPLKFELVNNFRDFMALEFPEWKLNEDKRAIWGEDRPTANHTLEYEKESEHGYGRIDLNIYFNSNRQGTTCVLKQIGEETVPEKKVPVWEVVCQDGANEEI